MTAACINLALAADPDRTARVQWAFSTLLIITVALVVLLLLLATVRRALRRHQSLNRERKPTTYVDAWAESGRRMKAPPEDDGSGKV